MKIVKILGGFYYVDIGTEIIECRARGKLRQTEDRPKVGDNVTLMNDGGFIDEVVQRKNTLMRPSVSNLDQLAIIIACSNPAPNFDVVDKILVQCEIAKITPLIIINKLDLGSSREIEKIYKKTGYKIIKLGRNKKKIFKFLKNKTTAFAGNSGVGKSTIMGSLGVTVQTGELSKNDRGKHTTRHVELVKIKDNTYVLDTPGFGSFNIENIKHEMLKECFPEMKQCCCDFDDCNHLPENGERCGVFKSVGKKISKNRYDSYVKIYDKLEVTYDN